MYNNTVDARIRLKKNMNKLNSRLTENIRNALRKRGQGCCLPWRGYNVPVCLSGEPLDKVVVGSYMGMLRIFSPHASKSSEDVQADAQLLEVQLQNAIIQVELGKFVS